MYVCICVYVCACMYVRMYACIITKDEHQEWGSENRTVYVHQICVCHMQVLVDPGPET